MNHSAQSSGSKPSRLAIGDHCEQFLRDTMALIYSQPLEEQRFSLGIPMTRFGPPLERTTPRMQLSVDRQYSRSSDPMALIHNGRRPKACRPDHLDEYSGDRSPTFSASPTNRKVLVGEAPRLGFSLVGGVNYPIAPSSPYS